MEKFDDLGMQYPPEDAEALLSLSDQVRPARWPCPAPMVALEVGSWAGRTALLLAKKFDSVYCVDHWEGTENDAGAAHREMALALGGKSAIFKTFCRNIGDKLFNQIVPCVGPSLLWAGVPWPFQFDLIYIDADHRYLPCRADVINWFPHLRVGGIMCGHDCHADFPGVQRVVSELKQQCDVQFHGRTIWSFRKESSENPLDSD